MIQWSLQEHEGCQKGRRTRTWDRRFKTEPNPPKVKKKKKSMQEENSIAPAQELLGPVRESQNMTRREASRTRREWDSGLS